MSSTLPQPGRESRVAKDQHDRDMQNLRDVVHGFVLKHMSKIAELELQLAAAKDQLQQKGNARKNTQIK